MMTSNPFMRSLYCYMSEGEGGAPESTGGTSTTEASTATTETTSTTEVNEFYKSLPEAYQDKEYFKSLKSADDLYQQFDNAQKLIGKKTIPDESSTPEQWEEFFNKLRPASPDEYQLPEPTFSNDQEKQLFESARVPEITAEMKKVFHANGLSAKQASSIVEAFEKAQIAHVLPAIKAAQEQAAAEDKAFDDFVKSQFGDRTDAVIESGKKLLESSLPASVKPKLANLPGEALGIMAIALEGVKAQYVNEGGVVGAPTSAVNPYDISAKMRKNFAELATMDPTTPQYQQMAKENEELAKQLLEARKQK